MKDKADTGTAGMERKIREMSRAYKVESMLTKNQIIEKYLNIMAVVFNQNFFTEKLKKTYSLIHKFE